MRANQRPRWEPLRLVHLGSATLIVIVLILAALSGGGARPAAAMAAQAPLVGPLQVITATATGTATTAGTATATRTATATLASPPTATPTAAPTATPTVVAPATGTPTATATRTPTPPGARGSTAEETQTAVALTATATLFTPTLTATPAGTPGTNNQCAGTGGPENLPDAFEPGDNSPGGATPIGDGETQDDHNLCSATTGPDEDWFQFSASINRQYTIFTSNQSPVVDTFLRVEGPAGSGFVQTDDDSGGSLASSITFVPSIAGIYRFQITQSGKTPFQPAQRNEPRGYDVSVGSVAAATPTPTNTPAEATVTPTPTPSPCVDEFEFDDDLDNAEAIFVNKPQRHVLCGDGDVDWVFFNVVADKPYRLFTSDLAPGVDTLIVLYGEDGVELVTQNDDFPGLGLASQINLTPSVTTRYYLKVQDFDRPGRDRLLLHPALRVRRPAQWRAVPRPIRI